MDTSSDAIRDPDKVVIKKRGGGGDGEMRRWGEGERREMGRGGRWEDFL
jgi:hypothetical protein